uniref:Crossover junction endonuclease MUS81 n=1 Tax=Setaria italica TaxID=4555 RepID=K3XQ25_SETIT
MAPPAPMQHKVRLPENEEVARALHEKRLAMREQPAGFKEHLDRTFGKAYRNVCASTEPIRTLKEFSKIKGVGPWLIRCMKGFFAESSQDLSPTKCNVAGENGKKPRGPKRCVPKKKTAASGSPGDGIWIARHRKLLTEYVLDFIVERKNVADLASSIRDNRYKDQKSRLQSARICPTYDEFEGKCRDLQKKT